MIKIIVDSEETKKRLIEESEYIHYELPEIDSEKASTLMHLYMLPDDCWVIEPSPPKPPKPPPGRLLSEDGANGICEKCGSSLHSKFIFWTDGCIQPKCENYYK